MLVSATSDRDHGRLSVHSLCVYTGPRSSKQGVENEEQGIIEVTTISHR